MKCSYCLIANAEVEDHFYPYCKGGRKKENLIPSCKNCNTKKGSRVFWSIDAARDYLMANISYDRWLRERMKAKLKPKYFEIFKYVLDN